MGRGWNLALFIFMKHQVKRRRYVEAHKNVFMLGVTRLSSNGWDWRCDGDTDPLKYWRRWKQRKIHVGFHTITLDRTERYDETSYREFCPGFPPGTPGWEKQKEVLTAGEAARP